jgi:MATE family multidrug resistance protein
MTLADTLLIGRLGVAELAGVALGGLASFVLLCFGFGLLRGMNTLVAQAVGARRTAEIPALRTAALAAALGLGVVTLVLAEICAHWLLPHLTASLASATAASTYLSVRGLAAPLALAYVALREVSYGQGDTRAPMRATLVANLVNITLACLMMLVLRRGVAGVALATVIAHAVELAVLAMHQRGQGLARPRARHFRALWRIGAPTGVQFLLEIGSFALLSLFISLLSVAEMAAHQITIQVIHFSFLPAWAVGEAAGVMVGQAVGANHDQLVRRVARVAALVTGVYAALCGLLFALGATTIARGFTPNPEVVSVTTRLLYVAAVFQVFDAANVVARSVLRGTGDVRFAAVVGVSSAWLATPPLAWLLGYRLGLGAFGGWLGLCLEIIVAATILALRVERGGWAPAAAASRQRLAAGHQQEEVVPLAAAG